MAYTITNIDKTSGNITVTFDVDNKPQALAGMPLDDAQALKQALTDYDTAYQDGLAVEEVTVDPAVTALVGKKQADTPTVKEGSTPVGA